MKITVANINSATVHFWTCILCDMHKVALSARTRFERKRTSNFSDHEDDIKKIALDLHKEHRSKYNEQKIRLWARMIVNGQHESTTEPSDIPIITGINSKLPAMKENMAEVLTGAATAFAKALWQTPEKKQKESLILL